MVDRPKDRFINIIKTSDIKINAVIDWDGVLQNIEMKWMNNLFSEKDSRIKDALFKLYDFSPIKNLKTEDLIKFFIDRDIYYFEEYFKYSNIDYKELSKIFYEYYLDDETFYDDIPFNYFYMNMKSIIESDNCENVTILTHIGYDSIDNRKERIFNEKILKNIDEKYHSKLKFKNLSSNITKSQYILKNLPKTNLVVDDAPHVIEDYFKNLKNATIIIVEYGYNKNIIDDYSNPDTEIYKFAKENNIVLVKVNGLENVIVRYDL